MNAHTKTALFEGSKGGSEKENQLTLELLQAIDQKDDISQRHLAQEMGVALGLANSYLKRCVKKGWIKMTTAPANRYLYYLTPNGFAEKARLTTEFFSTSLALFRESGDAYSNVFKACAARGHKRVVLAGLSDLTEIALMRAMQSDISVIAIFQPDTSRTEFFNVPIVGELPARQDYDSVILSSMEQTTGLIEQLEATLDPQAWVVPPLLLNMNYRNPDLNIGNEHQAETEQTTEQT